jgi:holo-[acyl-carrier protein] synthase
MGVIAGVGLDVIDIARVRAMLAAKGDRALARLFTVEEQRYCVGKAVPERHFAARLAAKEAAFKALSGTNAARRIGWREIEIRVDERGRPIIVLHERASRRAQELRVRQAWVSLTHGETVAAALVILESDT